MPTVVRSVPATRNVTRLKSGNMTLTEGEQTMSDARYNPSSDRGTYIPDLERRPRLPVPPTHGWQSGRMAREQDNRGTYGVTPPPSVRYTLYTEAYPNLVELVSRYFAGATFFQAEGLWFQQKEATTVIEIIGTEADRQQVVYLAGDIRHVNAQSSVLVTWETVGRLDVMA